MASSSTLASPNDSYHVFINHRGVDVKKTLASHLYHRLRSAIPGLRVFLDKPELRVGNDFPSQIQEAIRTASVHVAIFSRGYAESEWCLNELFYMLESGVSIIPIFYHVQPADLRRTQSGDGVYSMGLRRLEPQYDSTTLQKWRDALSRVSHISGLDLQDTCNGDEGELVEKVVQRVSKEIDSIFSVGIGAFAISGEFGILEGRSASLIHPIVMGGLFVYTLWTGYLGWQWRRIRTIQDEINELKKQVNPQPKKEGDPPAPPSPIETKIQQLTEERKGLLKGSFGDRHFNAGSILLGFGVFEAIGGGFNTWARTGKLFPGPHLFAGAGITILWAFAAALVPAMQKGNDVARSLHIALNAVNVLLFIWQIPTGIEIVLKVLEFTKWP